MTLNEMIDNGCENHPLLAELIRLEPTTWFNPALAPTAHALGDVPLAGFFAGGEIAHHHLYGYTGVLTVFVDSEPVQS